LFRIPFIARLIFSPSIPPVASPAPTDTTVGANFTVSCPLVSVRGAGTLITCVGVVPSASASSIPASASSAPTPYARVFEFEFIFADADADRGFNSALTCLPHTEPSRANTSAFRSFFTISSVDVDNSTGSSLVNPSLSFTAIISSFVYVIIFPPTAEDVADDEPAAPPSALAAPTDPFVVGGVVACPAAAAAAAGADADAVADALPGFGSYPDPAENAARIPRGGRNDIMRARMYVRTYVRTCVCVFSCVCVSPTPLKSVDE
jgi:hypothetical protein